MLYPTSFIKGRGLGTKCALITDGRFSGGTSGISVGHVSPEAAAGGLIGLVETGDRILIDVNEAKLELLVDPAELEERRIHQEEREHPWTPEDRERHISPALKLYGMTALSASQGAARDVSLVARIH